MGDEPIPKEWLDRGYGGKIYAVPLEDHASGALPSTEQIDNLKRHVPYECTPDVWLALAVETIDNRPHLMLVKKS